MESSAMQVDENGEVWCPCDRCKGRVQKAEHVAYGHLRYWGLYTGKDPNPIPHRSVLTARQRRVLDRQTQAERYAATHVIQPSRTGDGGVGVDTREGSAPIPAPGSKVMGGNGTVDEERLADDILAEEMEVYEMLYEQFLSPLPGVDDPLERRKLHRRSRGNRLISPAERAARVPLYPGSTMSRLSVSFRVLNGQSKFHTPNNQVDYNLAMIHEMLPKGNTLPRTVAEMKKVLNITGLEYERIHCCSNGCVLYRGEYENLSKCPMRKCGKPRYQVGTTGRLFPIAVLRYLPLIPRLKGYFLQQKYATAMRWHAENRSTDGKLRYVFDGSAWKHMEDVCGDFSRDPRNIVFGLSADGMNAYTGPTHSIWPVMLINYNIRPWIAIRKEHILLSMVISGPKKGKNLDVYLAPLIDELLQLWDGVEAYDASVLAETNPQFRLRALLLWTISDWPGLGALSHFKTSGYGACYRCGPDMVGRRSTLLNSEKYHEGRTFLPADHPDRFDTINFNAVETRGPPDPPSLAEWHRRAMLAERGVQKGVDTGIHRWSIFFKLPYWERLLVRHLVDTMHVEQNVTKAVLKHLYGDVDVRKVLLDCQKDGVQRPAAQWKYDTGTLKKFNELLSKTRLPTGYGPRLEKACSSERGKRPHRLKSHDYHKIMHDLLPAMLAAHGGDVGKARLRDALYRLSELFRWICQKEITRSEIEHYKAFSKQLLVDLEKVMPRSFFDLQIHLIMHLVEDVEMCGPVHARWMYFIERYIGQMKKDVKQQAKPEASIVVRHIQYENLVYMSDALVAVDREAPVGWQECLAEKQWELKFKRKGEVKRFRTAKARDLVHDCLLLNHPALGDLLDDYMARLRVQRGHPNGLHRNITSFKMWLRLRISERIRRYGEDSVDAAVKALAAGPNEEYKSYRLLVEGGRNFRVNAIDGSKKCNDSGICCMTIVGMDEEPTVFYCGVVEDLMEVVVGDERVALIKGKWYDEDMTGRPPGTVHDPCGFYRVNTSKYAKNGSYMTNPYLFPTQVERCFYVDLSYAGGPWKLVIPTSPRLQRRHVMPMDPAEM